MHITQVKSYVRRGLIEEAIGDKVVLEFKDKTLPNAIVYVLEGKVHRQVNLTPNRKLYEAYYPGSFVGLEDHLCNSPGVGHITAHSGSHYVLWTYDDCLKTIETIPSFAKKAIISLSKRIRIYHSRERHMSMDLRHDVPEEPAGSTEDLNESIMDGLHESSFSSYEQFPEEMIREYSVSVNTGNYVIHQGERSRQIYIILSGEVRVVVNYGDKQQEVDILNTGDFVGEMAIFDSLPRSADVIANTNTLLLELSLKNFDLLFNLHSKWSMKILDTLAHRLENRRNTLIH